MSSNLNGTICTPEELALPPSSGSYCLTRGDSLGLIVVVISGFFSLTAIVLMFTLILRNVIRVHAARAEAMRVSPNQRPPPGPMQLFLEKPMNLYLENLFQALAVVLGVEWVNKGRIKQSGLCTAQGIFEHLGQTGVAMSTLVITLHTFITVWRGREPRKSARVIVGALWLFLVLFIAISASTHKNPPFYYPTLYWCWISKAYPHHRIAGENLWLWIALTSSILYIPLIFWNLGYITPDNHTWWKFTINKREKDDKGRVWLALTFSALAYCIPVFPTSLARFFLLIHEDLKPFGPPKAQFSVKFIFSLSGVFDVVIFLLTRKGLLLFEDQAGGRRTRPISSQSQANSQGYPISLTSGTSTEQHAQVRGEA